jgi:hypothetical protein
MKGDFTGKTSREFLLDAARPHQIAPARKCCPPLNSPTDCSAASHGDRPEEAEKTVSYYSQSHALSKRKSDLEKNTLAQLLMVRLSPFALDLGKRRRFMRCKSFFISGVK